MKTQRMTYLSKGLALLLSAALILCVLGTSVLTANAATTTETPIFMTFKQPDPEVPNVVGKTYEESQTILSTSSFGCEVTAGSEDPSTIVREQTPAAGTLAPEGTVVSLITDPEVPYVISMTVDQAKELLSQTGLAWDILGPQDAGSYVIAQDPESGIAPRGTTVALATKKDNPPAPDPDPDPDPDPPAPKPTPAGGDGKVITPKTADLTYNLFTIMLIVIGAYFALSYSRQKQD